MKKVQRFDTTGRLGKAERTSQGYVKIPALLTRAGVFPYRQPDGSVRMEYRPADELKKAMGGLKHAPVTDLHPPVPVTPKTHRDVAVGLVADDVAWDEQEQGIQASLIVQDEETIEKVDRGEREENSCGYRCRIDETPGEFNGVSYDVVQRDYDWNHDAIGPKNWGRLGKPVSFRLDAHGDEVAPYAQDEEATVKVTIDGKEFDVPEAAGMAYVAQQAKRDAADEAAKAREDGLRQGAEALQKRVDEAEKKAAAATKLAEDSASVEKIDAAVAERTKLLETARRMLPADAHAKLAGMSPRQVREFALSGGKETDAKLKDYSDDMLRVRFDTVAEITVERSDQVEADLRTVAGAGQHTREDASDGFDPAKADAELKRGTEQLWRRKKDQPAAAAK